MNVSPQDNGESGVVVTTSQTISSDSMVREKLPNTEREKRSLFFSILDKAFGIAYKSLLKTLVQKKDSIF